MLLMNMKIFEICKNRENELASASCHSGRILLKFKRIVANKKDSLACGRAGFQMTVLFAFAKINKTKTRTLSRIIFFSFLSFSLFCCSSGPPPAMTDPGALIYYGYVNKDAQCSRCHGDEGQGGMFGPKIREVVQRLGIDSVRTIIEIGRGKGDKKMPDFADELTSAQIEQIIRFLQTWKITAPVDSIAAGEAH